MVNELRPTKQVFFKNNIFGFDIETYNNNKSFLCCSLVGEYIFRGCMVKYEKTFYSPTDFINEIKTNKIFRKAYIFATNLSFDFFGTFFNSDEIGNFKTLFRGSNLLYAKAWFENDNFVPYCWKDNKKGNKTLKSLTFLDTMNYAMLSVKEMGKIIGLPKLELLDGMIGNKPQTKEEWDLMIQYNIRDSWVSVKFMRFFIDGVMEMGGTFKNTIASTSMALFKNKYLKDKYYQSNEDVLLEQFQAYYGGRTEAFKRGNITSEHDNLNYYDFNSLYPSVMIDNDFPNPNSLRIIFDNSSRYIDNFHGISDVEVEVPEHINIPLLPFRKNNKLLFPVGKFRGWYSHIELRKLKEIGGKILKVHKTHYYTKTCSPFKEYVVDNYNLRLENKKINSPMQLINKLFMNSLYGKFGQRFFDRDNFIHEKQVTNKMIESWEHFERIGDFFRVGNITTPPSNFCVPIWALYITAKARLKLFGVISNHETYYCDTDSIVTPEELPSSKALGDLKLEMKINNGVIVKTKFYAVQDGEHEYVKIKGLGMRLNFLEFLDLLKEPRVSYKSIGKFKECVRRGLIPNETKLVEKEFGLEDEKRIWEKEFNPDELQSSKPIILNEE